MALTKQITLVNDNGDKLQVEGRKASLGDWTFTYQGVSFRIKHSGHVFKRAADGSWAFHLGLRGFYDRSARREVVDASLIIPEDFNEPVRNLGCVCCDRQLEQVGCACQDTYELRVTEVYLDGYASDNVGRFEYIASPGFDPKTYAGRAFGGMVAIARDYPYRPKPRVDTRTDEQKASDEAYARMMSRNDNS